MTQTETLNSLADRIEALEGPDRKIDAEIESERRRRDAYAAGLTDKQRAHWEPDSGGYVSSQGVTYAAKQFTASLDAAMTLVPDDWSMSLHFGPWIAGNVQAINPVTAEEFRIDAATPALAICAAAMRAKAVSA